MERFVERDQRFTQEQIAKLIRVRLATISIWRRDPAFRKAYAARIVAGTEVEIAWMHRAAVRRATNGSYKFYELVLRKLGEIDGPFDSPEPGREGVPNPTVQVGVGVAFYGLPQPPTPAQAEAMRPPPGSTMVVTAAGILEDRARKDGKA